MSGDLSGKVGLITGAGSGIGRETALRFAREGARVVVSDVNVKGGEETAELVRRAGGEAVVWLCSDRASFVTGLAMSVDGGSYAQ